jgi:hypothetical protein
MAATAQHNTATVLIVIIANIQVFIRFNHIVAARAPGPVAPAKLYKKLKLPEKSRPRGGFIVQLWGTFTNFAVGKTIITQD